MTDSSAMFSSRFHSLFQSFHLITTCTKKLTRVKELASSGRAVCRNKECKDNQVKIEKGTLRFCTQVEMGGHQSWAYKHW